MLVTKMQAYTAFFVLVTLAVTLSSATPKPTEHHGKHKPVDRKLSDSPHFRDDEEDDEHHNPEYDHEAFLGREEAKRFDQLSPEEAKDRLSDIYDRIDQDQNGQVTEPELVAWIKKVQHDYIGQDTEKQWQEHKVGNDNLLTWEAFNERTYGFMNEADKGDDLAHYENMKNRDKHRWMLADKDPKTGAKDGKLSLEEFSHFLHPEEVPHMKDVVVNETMEDIDTNKDGKVSLEEYIKDLWPNEDNEEEPDWVKTEKEQFATNRDKNKDGFLDHDEVRLWIIPDDYDHSEAEAKHLISESDTDKDNQISREECLNKYDLFVGSQATDFGEYLNHDEF